MSRIACPGGATATAMDAYLTAARIHNMSPRTCPLPAATSAVTAFA